MIAIKRFNVFHASLCGRCKSNGILHNIEQLKNRNNRKSKGNLTKKIHAHEKCSIADESKYFT